MPKIIYSEVEQQLISIEHYFEDVDVYDFSSLSSYIENENNVIVAFYIELGRCPSKDVRTYILHWCGGEGHYMENYSEFTWLDIRDKSNIKEIYKSKAMEIYTKEFL